MNKFSEKDWKIFRSKIAGWQEAYMDKLNKEYIKILSGDGKPCLRYLDYILECLQKLLPEFKIANAVIHFDEASPHMHVVGVPVWEGAKRGLSKKVSKRNVFTPQTLSVILQDKLREEASYGFECYFKEQLAEKKKGRNHDLSVTWRDCWRVWRRWLEKFIKK